MSPIAVTPALARRALGLAEDADGDAAGVTVRPLAAGAYHEHTLVAGPDGAEAVLRIPTGSQWGLPLAAQLDRERRTLAALESTGVAPAPLGLLAETDPPVLVEEHVAGRRFSYATDLTALGRALAAVHAVPAPAHLPRVDAATALLDDAWERLAAAAPGESHDLLAARAAELEPASEADGAAPPRDLLGRRTEALVEARVPPEGLVLVHTDVHPGNLVVADPGGRVRLLDWEAARLGAAEWDLAHAIAPSTTLWAPDAARELDGGDVAQLLGAYAAAARPPEDPAELAERVRALLPVVVVRALAWVLCAHAEGLRSPAIERFAQPDFVRYVLGWDAIAANIPSSTRGASRSTSTSTSPGDAA